MLETFRKHHYVLMCLVAVVVIISFTFFFNPNTQSGRAGSGEVVRKIFDADLTQGEVELIEQQKTVASQIAGEKDSVMDFLQTMHSIADESKPMDSRMADADYSTNVFLMRQECERLGIAVEKEDITARIRLIANFQTNGQFDGSLLDKFLSLGQHGDRSATETKLYNAVRDVMLFERLAALIGGTYAPSSQEIDADFARANESITVATALLAKKDYEAQTITDEEIQKFYDTEKAKQDNADKTVRPDPIILTDEKRTVKYCITEAPKSTAVPPQQPPPLPALPPKPDLSALPEAERKAKEEERKKLEDDHAAKQKLAQDEFMKQMDDYQKQQKEVEAAKQAWLVKVSDLSNALVAEERGSATFEELAKPLEPPPAPAPAPAPAPVPAPAPIPAPIEATPPPAAPAPVEAPPVEQPKAVQGAQGPAGTEGQPSAAPVPVPAETPPVAVEPASICRR